VNSLRFNKEAKNPLKVILFLLTYLVFLGYLYRGEIGFNFEFPLGTIFILGLYIAWKERFNSIDHRILLWGAVLLFYWFSAAISTLYHYPLADRGDNLFAINHLVILFIGLSLAVYYLKPSIDYFWILMGLVALAMVALIFLESAAVGLQSIANGQRIGGVYSQIVKMGVFANIFFIILLGSLPWAYKKGWVFVSLWSVLILLLLLGVILTQSRTAWLGWPEAIIVWTVYYYFLLKKSGLSKKLKLTLSLLPLMISLSLFSVKPINDLFEKRLTAIYDNVDQYYFGGEFRTSIGTRLLGYEVALSGIKKHPWLGIGEDAFPAFQKEQSANLALEKFNIKIGGYTFHHIHNQFLMSWLTKGVFSFISVLFIFLFLMVHFITGLRAATFENKPIWIAGIVFSVASLMSFMPETPLQKSDTSAHFFLMATLLVVFSILTEQRQNKLNIEYTGKSNL